MKILVVRFKQIGDAILSSVICNTLKRTFPDAEVDYVVYEYISPLFKNHKYIDNVISITKEEQKNPFKYIGKVWKVTRKKYDIVIDIMSTPKSENHKYIDNVISITKEEQKNPFKYIGKVWKVTRKKYDIVIDIMSTPKSEVFTLFSLGSRYRIGRRKPKRGYTYNYKIEEPRDAKDKVDKFLKMLKPLEQEYKVIYDNNYVITLTSEEKSQMRKRMLDAGVNFRVDKFLKMLKPLEQEYKVIYDNNYVITLTSEEKSQMRKRMLDAGVNFSRPVYICAANSRRESKIYNTEKMKKIVERVRDELKGQVIFFYSPDEKDRRESKIYNTEKMKKIVERVRDELKGQVIFFYSPDEKDFIMKFYEKFEDKKDLFVNINTKSIRELAMVISNCDFFFGNEGGPRHLAQSLDIPSFAIFSPSASKKEWLSNANERHQGVEPGDVGNCEGLDYNGQYNLIDPDYVFDKIEEMSKKFIVK